MSINLKPWLGMLCGGIGGGFIGWSQILCVNGQCAITGTWIGGALMGAVMGFLIFGFIIGDMANPSPPSEPPSETDAPQNTSSSPKEVSESTS